jgi:DNA-binding NtrC family response regulator
MTPNPAVLLSLRAQDRGERVLRDHLEDWVQRCGFPTRFTEDAEEAVSWMGEGPFVASFVDSELQRPGGAAVWRLVRPTAVRRVVLMARERGRDLWFEALRSGVATVLPLPPQEAMVRAALEAVAGVLPTGGGRRSP